MKRTLKRLLSLLLTLSMALSLMSAAGWATELEEPVEDEVIVPAEEPETKEEVTEEEATEAVTEETTEEATEAPTQAPEDEEPEALEEPPEQMTPPPALPVEEEVVTGEAMMAGANYNLSVQEVDNGTVSVMCVERNGVVLGELDDQGDVTGDTSHAQPGDKIILEVRSDPSYQLQNLNYRNLSDNSVSAVESDDYGRKFFTMIAADVQIEPSFTTATAYNVTTVDGIVNGTLTSLRDSAPAGDTVRLITGYGDEYTLGSLTVTNCNTGEMVPVPPFAQYFVMPEANVEVYATFVQSVQRKISVNISGNGAVVAKDSGGNGITSIVGGSRITLEVTPNDGNELTSLTVTGSTTSIVFDVTTPVFNFTMPTEDVTVTAVFKQPQTITLNGGDSVELAYGDTDRSVSATTTGEGAISYAVREGSEEYIDVDANTGELTIKKVPADGKAYVIVIAAETTTYAQATKSVTIIISRANAVAATVTANNRTFDGTEHPLVTVTGEAIGGEMQYALGTATEATGSYFTNIPKATEKGTYYVWYKVVGDSNHNDTQIQVVPVTVSEHVHNWSYRADGATITAACSGEGDCDITDGLTLTLKAPTSLTYDGKAKEATLSTGYDTTAFPGQYAITYTKDGKAVTEAKNAGKYTASVKVGNATASVSFTIAPKQVGLKWTNTSFTYNGKSHVPKATATGLVSGDTCTVTVTGAQTNAGTYTATASKLSNANYKLPSAKTAKFTIAKADQKAPSAPVVTAITGSSITVKTVKGQQYSIDGGKTWKTASGSSYTYKNLTPGKAYTLVTRKPASANYNASPKSAGNRVKTLSNAMLLRSGLKVQETTKNEKTTITVTCGAVPGATSYEVYIQYCGKTGFSDKPTATIKNGKTSVTLSEINGSAIKTGKSYKLRVVAMKGKTELCRTPVVHGAGTSSDYTDIKSVTLNKTAVSLEKGKTFTIKAKLTLQNSKKEPLSETHDATLRFLSSDASVATVDKNGKITARGAGTCVIMVTARNGISKSVTVTVK